MRVLNTMVGKGGVTSVTGLGTTDEANEFTSTYRTNGQVETLTDANGNTTSYAYGR
jgi:hypothetical protein